MILAATTIVFVVTLKIRVGTLLVVEDFALILKAPLVALSESDYSVTPVYSLLILARLTPCKHPPIVNIRRCYMPRSIQKTL